jgi:hypothetical protein
VAYVGTVLDSLPHERSRYIVFLEAVLLQRSAEEHMVTGRSGHDLRVGDADREAVAAHLREHFAQGRLTLDEFNGRLDAAFAAVKQSDLDSVTTDLPHVGQPRASLPVSGLSDRERDWQRSSYQPGGWGNRPTGWSYQQYDQNYRTRSGYHRLGLLSTLVTVIVSWLILVDLVLPHFRYLPWPGSLAILITIFGAVRWILRRIFGGGRTGRPSHPRPTRPRRGRPRRI